VTALLASIRLAKQLEKEAKDNIERITYQLVDPNSDEFESLAMRASRRQSNRRRCATRPSLLSFPGIGPLNLATLLTEATDGVRDRDYQALRCQGGVAPVTKQSGKSRSVVQAGPAISAIGDARRRGQLSLFGCPNLGTSRSSPTSRSSRRSTRVEEP
jgi:transposase